MNFAEINKMFKILTHSQTHTVTFSCCIQEEFSCPGCVRHISPEQTASDGGLEILLTAGHLCQLTEQGHPLLQQLQHLLVLLLEVSWRWRCTLS